METFIKYKCYKNSNEKKLFSTYNTSTVNFFKHF